MRPCCCCTAEATTHFDHCFSYSHSSAQPCTGRCGRQHIYAAVRRRRVRTARSIAAPASLPGQRPYASRRWTVGARARSSQRTLSDLYAAALTIRVPGPSVANLTNLLLLGGAALEFLRCGPWPLCVAAPAAVSVAVLASLLVKHMHLGFHVIRHGVSYMGILGSSSSYTIGQPSRCAHTARDS